MAINKEVEQLKEEVACLKSQLGYLKSAFTINMMRAHPEMTSESIESAIQKVFQGCVPSIDKPLSGRQVPPEYRRYIGGFRSITKCTSCRATSLYEDAHPTNPCIFCGGKVKRAGAARWVEPVYKWKCWLKWELVSEGYWEEAFNV